MNQQDLAAAFRKLHEGVAAFIMPNPWDVGSARLLENQGFKALATTSAGLAFSLGRPDGENAVSRDEALAHSIMMVSAVAVPVSADLEKCFADDPEGCAETIRLAVGCGLAGGSIEDATGNPETPIFAFGHAVDRVRAAAEAAAGRFVLTARAENYLHGRPDLADTIRRLQAYQEAGADVLFAPGLKTAEDIRAVVTALDRPVNVVMGLQGVLLSAAELSGLGVKRISTGGSLARAAYGALIRAGEEMSGRGTFSYADAAVPHGVINRMFGGN